MESIKNIISLKDEETLLLPSNFNKLGLSEGVRLTLHRLSLNYVSLKISKYLGVIFALSRKSD